MELLKLTEEHIFRSKIRISYHETKYVMKLGVFYFMCLFDELQGKRFLSECNVVALLFINSLLLRCVILSVIK
jgi:hypothetical protein